MNQLKSQGKF